MRFEILGIKIEVSFLFLAVITFMFFIDKSGFLLPMAIAIFLHEAAHISCMSILGFKAKEIKLIPGGIQIIRSFCLKKKYEILISISGPFINFILFVLFWNLNLQFSAINLCIGILNILPLKSLDGGEILEIVLEDKISEDKVKKILITLNLIIGILGIIVEIFLILNKSANISLILFSIYLILSVIIKF